MSHRNYHFKGGVHPKKIIIPKEEIEKLYSEGMTMEEVAKELGTTKRVIHLRMQEYQIKRRENHGAEHGSWKGGRVKKTGYWAIWNPTHHHANNVGYVKEHILVLEKELGRNIGQNEFIHHINYDKLDNRLENLWLTNGHKQHSGCLSTLLKIVKPLIEKGILGFKEGEYFIK